MVPQAQYIGSPRSTANPWEPVGKPTKTPGVCVGWHIATHTQPMHTHTHDLHGLPIPMLHPSYDYLLVVIDHLTLQVHLIPTTTRITAKEVAWIFFIEIVSLHRVPESIVSD